LPVPFSFWGFTSLLDNEWSSGFSCDFSGRALKAGFSRVFSGYPDFDLDCGFHLFLIPTDRRCGLRLVAVLRHFRPEIKRLSFDNWGEATLGSLLRLDPWEIRELIRANLASLNQGVARGQRASRAPHRRVIQFPSFPARQVQPPELLEYFPFQFRDKPIQDRTWILPVPDRSKTRG
jgi:hypothetical protein